MEDAKAPRGKIIEKNKQFFFLTSEGFLPLSFYFCGTHGDVNTLVDQ